MFNNTFPLSFFNEAVDVEGLGIEKTFPLSDRTIAPYFGVHPIFNITRPSISYPCRLNQHHAFLSTTGLESILSSCLYAGVAG